jgi:hypothetical protein
VQIAPLDTPIRNNLYNLTTIEPVTALKCPETHLTAAVAVVAVEVVAMGTSHFLRGEAEMRCSLAASLQEDLNIEVVEEAQLEARLVVERQVEVEEELVDSGEAEVLRLKYICGLPRRRGTHLKLTLNFFSVPKGSSQN